jgi:preprotein translocase subunit SecA
MFTWIAKKVFGTSNERAMRRIQPMVAAINALEPGLKELSDAELQAKSP